MKALIQILAATALANALISCAQSNPPVASTTYPYQQYSVTMNKPVTTTEQYQRWTTAQLQQRRTELYYMVPQGQTRRNGIPFYITHGTQTPQQDEIQAIEGELTRRYQAGYKTAELKPVWPEERRHIG